MPSEALLTAFRLQAGACRFFGSPLYGDLLGAVERELPRGGPLCELLESWEGDPVRGFLALRLMGTVHERALAGEAPELARFYPSTGGAPTWPGVWEAFLGVVEKQGDALRERLSRWPQTNEVRRCGTLLGGFLLVARRTGLPLRLREIGCSAGLHLHWHRYRYELGTHRHGDPRAAVRIRVDWSGPPPPLYTGAEVESAAGCDLAPVRVGDDAQARALEAYVWADQVERLAALRAALRHARREPPRVERASAGDWLETELAEVPRGVTRVLYHSAAWIYLDGDEQARIRALLEHLGSEATEATPLAWLSNESDDRRPGWLQLVLRLWPGGAEERLAEAHPHGATVRWLAESVEADDSRPTRSEP